MSDKEGTTPEEIYKYRLAHSEDRRCKLNDFDYYFIKKYESNMERYTMRKKITVIIILIIILLLYLLLSGFINTAVWIESICGIFSLFFLWYSTSEYKNSKNNRDMYIQNAKDKIKGEIQEKIKQEEKLNNLLKKSKDDEKKSKEDSERKIKEITPEITGMINKIANDNNMNDEDKKTALYAIYLDKIYNKIYYLDYYTEFIENNINFDQKIKNGVKKKISDKLSDDYANMH